MLDNQPVIPQLTASTVEPLQFLENHFIKHCASIEAWFESEWQKTVPPVYGSVDLRNAGFKLAPIDMNLFPGGFNNLNSDYLAVSVRAAKKILSNLVPDAKNILVIPESHTRNLRYWESVYVLQTILQQAGYVTRLAILSDEMTLPMTLALPSGAEVIIDALVREQDALSVAGFKPDMVLLNNDLSDGIPAILQNLSHPLIPPAELGWSQRLKSDHFQYYAEVTAEFAEKFNLDPWLIAPLFRHCGQIDFMQQEGLQCLIANAEILFAAIEEKYRQYHIPYQPFLIVKADAGTYGMAVMTVRSVDELRNLNRKQRTRMSTIKGGQPVRRVIIQEGVYTFETWGAEQAVAEPVVYSWGSSVVGGFYRVHQDRGTDENLNAPGMRFEPLAFPQPCHEPCATKDPSVCQNRFYLYGIIAQLSMLAAAREIEDQKMRKV